MLRSKGEKVFQVINILIMLFVLSVIIIPVLHICSISVSESEAVNLGLVTIFPKGFNAIAYERVINDPIFLRSLINTIGITVLGTIFSLVIIVMLAYAWLKEFFGKKLVTYYLVATMYFSGGLIPTYLLITKYLGMKNSYFALILPALVNVFYTIVIKSQIEAMPSSLMEAAIIDGANEFQVVFRIVIPVILPTIAAVSMFIALGKWNMWFPVMIYTNKKELWTLQYFLRTVIFDKFLVASELLTDEGDLVPPKNYQMASIVLVALPIVCIYPFVQKYFVKGILTGAIKG